MFEQGQEDVGQHFVRTVADEDLRGLQRVEAGDRALEPVRVRIRVELQVFAVLGGDRGDRARAGTVGVFVGVEFDEVGQLGLLARNVRTQALNGIAPESAHDVFLCKRGKPDRAFLV